MTHFVLPLLLYYQYYYYCYYYYYTIKSAFAFSLKWSVLSIVNTFMNFQRTGPFSVIYLSKK